MNSEQQPINYGQLRSNLRMIGCTDTEAVVDWFSNEVNEEDLMRQVDGCYRRLAETLDRCYREEREADADSKQHAADLEA